jgi:hypothetical protein
MKLFYSNREELSRLVSEKHSLSSLKIGGCSNLGFINLSSSSLEVLWLSDLCSLSKSVMLCSSTIYSNNNYILCMNSLDREFVLGHKLP